MPLPRALRRAKPRSPMRCTAYVADSQPLVGDRRARRPSSMRRHRGSPPGIAAGDRQQTCPTAWHRPGAAGGGRLASFSRPQDGDDPRPHRHRRPCARQLQPNAFARRHQRSDPHAALSCAGGSSLKPMWRRMIARPARSRPSAPRPRPAPWLRLAHPRPRRPPAQRRRRPAIGCRLGMRPHRDPACWPRPRRRGRCSSPSPR